jgi:hypothetical protein
LDRSISLAAAAMERAIARRRTGSIHRAVQNKWRDQTIGAQSRGEGCGFPMTLRDSCTTSLAARRVPVKPRHFGDRATRLCRGLPQGRDRLLLEPGHQGRAGEDGSCYKSIAFPKRCKRFGLKHIRTKPYTPKTNSKGQVAPQKREPQNCRDGFTATIGTGRTGVSAQCDRSADSP